MDARFITKLVEHSPLPPVGFGRFVDQLLISQASNGEKPLVFQAIACLNYRFNQQTGLEEVVPITSKTKRWQRFLGETGDFILALNELRVRPLFVFGISDVLNFEAEDTYVYPSDELHQRVEQNSVTMAASLSETIDSLSVPHPHMRPAVTVFTHSERLVKGTEHEVTFQRNSHLLRSKKHEVEGIRKWLIATFSVSHPYLGRLDPHAHREQLTQMMALYAADNQIRVQTAQVLFPGEQIEQVISLCLQPTHVPEWVAEKVATSCLGGDIIQITPMPNAGKWWTEKQIPATFSFRSERDALFLFGASQAFQTLMKKADNELLPDIVIQKLTLDELLALKQKKVTQLITMLFGEEHAQTAQAAFNAFLQKKREKKKELL